MWIVRMSERSNSSAFYTRSTPSSAHRSAVRFSLQAITFIPKAGAIVAT